MVTKIIKKSAEYWYSVVFTDEKRVKLTSDGIVRVFHEKTLYDSIPERLEAVASSNGFNSRF